MLPVMATTPFMEEWATRRHRYIHTDIHTYIHTFIHTHIHTHTHTYIHTTPSMEEWATSRLSHNLCFYVGLPDFMSVCLSVCLSADRRYFCFFEYLYHMLRRLFAVRSCMSYVYAHERTHIHTHTNTCTHTHIRTRAYIHTCIHT